LNYTRQKSARLTRQFFMSLNKLHILSIFILNSIKNQVGYVKNNLLSVLMF